MTRLVVVQARESTVAPTEGEETAMAAGCNDAYAAVFKAAGGDQPDGVQGCCAVRSPPHVVSSLPCRLQSLVLRF